MPTRNGDLFDMKFQRCFVNHMLRSSDFLQRVKEDIQPELFADETTQRIVRLILDHARDSGEAPGTLIYHIVDVLKDRQALSSESHEQLISYAEQLFELPLENRAYLEKEFIRWMKHQRFRRNMLPAIEYVKQGDFDRAEELMAEVFSFRPTFNCSLGTHYTADPTARIARRNNQDDDRFWTYVEPLDMAVPGILKKQVAILQSQRSSGGKTAAMAHLVRSFAFQGRKVLICTMEESEQEYEDRLDMCIAGLPRDDLADRTTIRSRLLHILRRGGDIHIRQFPGLSKVNDLKRFKKQLQEAEGFTPDVVIVDGINNLAPEGKYVDDSFSAGLQIMSALTGWAVEDNVAMWVAAQSNRIAMSAARADQEHMGGSIAYVWLAHLIISISRSPEEESLGITELYVEKNKNGAARFSIKIKSDWSRMQFFVRSGESVVIQ